MARRSLAFLALAVALLPQGQPLAAPARPTARGPVIAGRYDSPLGQLELEVRGAAVLGKLLVPGAACPFRAGEEILRGTVLDDSVAGQLRVWLRGDGCRVGEVWGDVVLLAGPAGLAGAVHVSEPSCAAPLGPRGGLSLARVEASGRRPREASKGAERARARRERARAILEDGAAWLGEGNFEAARKRFLEALDVDPRVPEALNGVGVTYRMRNELAAALEWYKRALAVDPDFGDAYYNMACVYALQGDRELALRYLQIAAMNGYASAEGIEADPDLAGLHDEPGYRALVRARL